jgi:hypothetical protein
MRRWDMTSTVPRSSQATISKIGNSSKPHRATRPASRAIPSIFASSRAPISQVFTKTARASSIRYGRYISRTACFTRGVSEAGLFASRDHGASWEPVDGINNYPGRESWPPGFGGLGLHTILSDAKNPNRMWVGISSSGFFRTDDGGKSWTQKSEGIPGETGQCVHHVAHDATNAGVLYRQEHRGVYMSADGGDTWKKIEDGLPISELSDGLRCSFGFPIVMDRRSGSVFVVPLEGDNFRIPRDGKLAVYRSSKGARWEPMRRGLPDNSYEGVLRGAMSADQLDPGGVYFGTTSGSIYGTRDTGDSWFEITHGLPRILSVEAYVL